MESKIYAVCASRMFVDSRTSDTNGMAGRNRSEVHAKLMSLGGIGIAIGATMDAVVVMIQNEHEHVERRKHRHT